MGVALRWEIAILKILAARQNGEASVSAIGRDLAILMTTKDRAKSQQFTLHASDSHALFADGLIDRPKKGLWRISKIGREYLLSLERPISEAAE